MNIVAYTIGELSVDPVPEMVGISARGKKKLTAATSWNYKRMLGLSVMSVTKYMQGFDEIRVCNAGATDWLTLTKRRFYFLRSLCLAGHTVFLCDADIMLLKPWTPPWETKRVKMWQPAPCPSLEFEGLGASRAKGEFMMCCPAIFPPGLEKLWDQAAVGFENALKVSMRHHLEQIALNFIYHESGGNPKEDTDLRFSYNEWAEKDGGWEPGVPPDEATWYHALGTRNVEQAWLRMKAKAEEVGLL